MELSLGKLLRCPAGTPGSPDRVFELDELYRLEARQDEVQNANRFNSAELMQVFVKGYGIAGKALLELEWELAQAKKHAESRKAVVYLDVAPTILKQKGLVRESNPSGSEDQRKAVLALDAEHSSLMDRISMLEAVIEFMKLKCKTFEQSYQAVKKMMDNTSPTRDLPDRMHATGGASSYTGEVTRPAGSTIAIGKPKY